MKRRLLFFILFFILFIAMSTMPPVVNAQGPICTTYDFADNGALGWYAGVPNSPIVSSKGWKGLLYNNSYVVDLSVSAGAINLVETEIIFDRGITGTVDIGTSTGNSGGGYISDGNLSNAVVINYTYSPAIDLLETINYRFKSQNLFYVSIIKICVQGATPTPTNTSTPTPGPTPTPTRTSFPSPTPAGTRTPTPTRANVFSTPPPTGTSISTPTPGGGTPHSAPMPNSVPFPRPQFAAPTSIPSLKLATWPAPLSISVGTPIPLHSISTTLNISYTTLLTNLSTITNNEFTLIETNWLSTTLTNIINYTHQLTTSADSLLSTTAVITIVSAPPEYVPDLPRPLADVGWTFETISDPDVTPNFSFSSWASFVGYIISLPFRLVKMLWIFTTQLGWLGLFLGWLFIVFALVSIIKLIKWLIHLVLTIIYVVLKIIDLIGQYLPTGG